MESRIYEVTLDSKVRWSFQFFSVGLATICIATDLKTKKTRAGIARMNERDLHENRYPYDISTGRKYALKYALENSDLDKSYKRLFFDEFFKEHERRDIWNRRNF